MATVLIPSALRSYTQNMAEVSAEGDTVGEVLRALEQTYPGIGARLLDEMGAVRRYVNIFLNDEDIRFLRSLQTPVSEQDRITLIPAIAGGAPSLTEEQILRYSRQILLREVGGRGQQRLLSSAVGLEGEGAALLTAAAYVFGGGSRVRAPARAMGRGEMGYLVSAADTRTTLDAVLTDAGFEVGVETLDPDIILREGAPEPMGEAGLIHVGGFEAEGFVLFAARGTCSTCVEASLRGVGPVPGSLEDLLGALAALMQQRLVLGLGQTSGVLQVAAPGLITSRPLTACPAHVQDSRNAGA